MAHMLVYAKDNTNPDPDIDRQGCYKKGYPVVVLDEVAAWGAAETLPNFIQLEITGVTRAQVEHYLTSWQTDLNFNIDSTNGATATYTITVTNNNVSVSGKNALTAPQIQSWLDKWGATFVSASLNSITLTCKLWDMVRSNGFWGADVSALVFTLGSYNSTSGIARIQVDYTATAFTAAGVSGTIASKEGVVISNADGVAVFDIERSDIYTKFKEAVKEALDNVYCRKQYYFDLDWVDSVVASGGVATITGAQAISLLKNKLDE